MSLLSRWGFAVGLVSFSAAFLNPPVVCGQPAYPSKPVRIIVPGIGGGSDFTARLIAQGIAVPLGESVIVDNRPAGVIAGQVVSQAQPDGYTLLVQGGNLWVGALLRKVPYDVLRDFAPISMTEMSPGPVVVHPSLPVKSIKELIALAKAKPGDMNYGATAIGSATHLAAELFNSMAGVKIVGVIYSSGTAAVTAALFSGETQVQFLGASSMPHVKSGRLRALAVSGLQPSALFPGLPTVAASGLPGYEAVAITGIFAPAKTPKPIIDRLNQEIVRVLNRQDVKEKFYATGIEVASSSPEQLADTMKDDITKWAKVIKEANIKTD